MWTATTDSLAAWRDHRWIVDRLSLFSFLSFTFILAFFPSYLVVVLKDLRRLKFQRMVFEALRGL
jgi:hypothetical protein